MRIAISRRPFSDGMEIIAVRPIVDIDLDDYKEADKIKELLKGDTRAMLIIGPPGSGKTTLVQGIATYLLNEGNIVKTMEQPRELQIPDEITQYTTLEGSMKNTADLLMLLRPDYVIFDDLRRNDDFEVFSDLRLAGIGMIGVMHALSPGEAICRFIDRVDLSVLHQVIGSIVFVYGGVIQTILTTDLILKSPDGMEGELTCRPVTVVLDLLTNEKVYEIFRCEHETIIMPASADIYESSDYVIEADTPLDTGSLPAIDEPFNTVSPKTSAMQISKELHIAEYVESTNVNHIFTEKESEIAVNSVINETEQSSSETDVPEEKNPDILFLNEENGEESASWEVTERDIQREIGRYTNGHIIVEMRSATKAIVYIDDRDVPAAIGKGGKNISGIVNRVGVGIDIRPESDMMRGNFAKNTTSTTENTFRNEGEINPINANIPGEVLINDGLHVRIDKKHLAIISPENIGRIVDVFSGREYLFTATVNESSEIILAKNSTIAQEMLKRYNEGEPIRLKTV
jgi:ATPase